LFTNLQNEIWTSSLTVNQDLFKSTWVIVCTHMPEFQGMFVTKTPCSTIKLHWKWLKLQFSCLSTFSTCTYESIIQIYVPWLYASVYNLQLEHWYCGIPFCWQTLPPVQMGQGSGYEFRQPVLQPVVMRENVINA